MTALEKEQAWREEQLRELGVPGLVARQLAARAGIHHDLKRLLARRCPLETALRIVQ